MNTARADMCRACWDHLLSAFHVLIRTSRNASRDCRKGWPVLATQASGRFLGVLCNYPPAAPQLVPAPPPPPADSIVLMNLASPHMDLDGMADTPTDEPEPLINGAAMLPMRTLSASQTADV